MRYGSVCSGIEAATAAWHPLGWKPSFFSEIDAFPRAVLHHHYPDVPLHGDFTTIQDGDYEPIELLVGGTPCQSFSVAGLRKGLDDPRGNLMLGFGALAKRLRPTWLVWENVPGVLSANGGRDFGTFLGMLGELGYGFAYRVLDAQYFGVAQRRRRVFVVGYLGDWRPPAAVLFERHSLSGHSAPSRETREETTGTPSSRTSGGGGLGTDFECAGGLQPVSMAHGQGGAEVGFNRGPTLTCNHEAPIVCHGTQDPIIGDNRAHALGRNNGAENALFVSLRGRDGGATAELGGPISGTLRASAGGGDKPHVMCFAQNSRDEVRLMPYAGALAAESGMKQTSYVFEQGNTACYDDPRRFDTKGVHGGGDKPHVLAFHEPFRYGEHQQDTLHSESGISSTLVGGSKNNAAHYTKTVTRDMSVRRLTPVECERLQGFPDNFTRIPYRNKPADKCPDGPRYKALGNSMAVPVIAWIGLRIQAVKGILVEQKEAAA